MIVCKWVAGMHLSECHRLLLRRLLGDNETARPSSTGQQLERRFEAFCLRSLTSVLQTANVVPSSDPQFKLGPQQQNGVDA